MPPLWSDPIFDIRDHISWTEQLLLLVAMAHFRFEIAYKTKIWASSIKFGNVIVLWTFTCVSEWICVRVCVCVPLILGCVSPIYLHRITVKLLTHITNRLKSTRIHTKCRSLFQAHCLHLQPSWYNDKIIIFDLVVSALSMFIRHSFPPQRLLPFSISYRIGILLVLLVVRNLSDESHVQSMVNDGSTAIKRTIDEERQRFSCVRCFKLRSVQPIWSEGNLLISTEIQSKYVFCSLFFQSNKMNVVWRSAMQHHSLFICWNVFSTSRNGILSDCF